MCCPGTSYMAGRRDVRGYSSGLGIGVESYQQYYNLSNATLRLPIQFFTGHLNSPTPIFSQGFPYYVILLLPSSKTAKAFPLNYTLIIIPLTATHHFLQKHLNYSF